MRQPAHCAGNGEQHWEHFERESHGLVDETRIEVHIGIEFAIDEIIVFKGDPLQFHGNVQQRILAGDTQHPVGHFLENPGARVVVLVHPVAEAHEPEIPLLDLFDV